jgi:hypothetical protein
MYESGYGFPSMISGGGHGVPVGMGEEGLGMLEIQGLGMLEIQGLGLQGFGATGGRVARLQNQIQNLTRKIKTARSNNNTRAVRELKRQRKGLRAQLRAAKRGRKVAGSGGSGKAARQARRAARQAARQRRRMLRARSKASRRMLRLRAKIAKRQAKLRMKRARQRARMLRRMAKNGGSYSPGGGGGGGGYTPPTIAPPQESGIYTEESLPGGLEPTISDDLMDLPPEGPSVPTWAYVAGGVALVGVIALAASGGKKKSSKKKSSKKKGA